MKKRKWSKFLAAILSICLVAASAPAALAQTAELEPLSAAPAAAPGDKYSKYTILKNGNFEEGTAGWSKAGTGFSFETSQTDAPEGDSAAVLTTAGAAGFIIQQVPLKSGSEFTLTLQVKGAAGTKGMIKVELAGTEGILTSVPAPVLEFTTTGEGWEKKTLTFQTTEETTRANLLVRLLSPEGTISYDDIYLDGPLTDEQQQEADKMEGGALPPDRYDHWTLVQNGSFENGLTDWIVHPNAEQLIAEITEEDAGEGEKAAVLTTKNSYSAYLRQVVTFKGDSEFTLSFKAKGTAGKTGLVAVQATGGFSASYSFTLASSEWEQHSVTFKNDGATTRANIMLRIADNDSPMAFDDVYLSGPLTEEQQKLYDQFEEQKNGVEEKPPVEGAADVMINGGYEELDGRGNPEGLQCFENWGDFAQVVQEDPHSGANCMKITATEPKYPWVRHTLTGLVPGATYQLTFYYKSDSTKPGYKFEFYGQRNTANPYYNSEEVMLTPKAAAWTKEVHTFTMPTLADEVQIYMRNYGIGTMYVDDLSLYMVEKPAAFERVITDRVFYYEHVKTGTASIALNSEYSGGDYTVKFALMDGETVLSESGEMAFSGNRASWSYSVAGLEKKKAYQIRATAKDREGNTQVLAQNIYRFDRPSYIDEQGRSVIDGAFFNPQILYHLYDTADIPTVVENGITVLQGQLKSTPEDMLAYLDEMEALGVKIAIPFYYNMKPAGHPDNVETVKAIVEAVKDHPAVFGYMIQDEPFAQKGSDVEKVRWLEDSYREIRLIDSKHPITICECFGNYYAESVKYCDMLIIDPYPGQINDYLTHVGEMGELAVETVPDNKPVLNLLQTFTFNYSAPEVGMVRHMAYQAYLTGQKYIGFYPWKSEGQVDPGNFDNLSQSPWWPEIVSFNQKEAELLFRHFATGENPTYSRYSDDGIMYESWTADGKVYVALINRTREAGTAAVSLRGQDGTTILSGTARVVAGGGQQPVIANGSMSVALSGSDCLLLEITPDRLSPSQRPLRPTGSAAGSNSSSGSSLTAGEGGKENPSTGAAAS